MLRKQCSDGTFRLHLFLLRRLLCCSQLAIQYASCWRFPFKCLIKQYVIPLL